MTSAYESDIVAWAGEQARLLRAGRFELLDIANIAEEIEDVGRAEQRELMSRMAVLLAHLLKWQYQPERRGNSWRRTIQIQREQLRRALKKTPSLKTLLANEEWWEGVWGDAWVEAARETGLDNFPEACPWTFAEIRDDGWLPAEEGGNKHSEVAASNKTWY